MKYFNFDASLTSNERAMRETLIQHILKHPTTPPAFKQSYTALYDKHMITVQNQQITCLYPFATHVTEFKVQLLSQPDVYAMCAIDALGVHYLLHQPITIESQCATTHAPIMIQLSNQQIQHSEYTKDIHVLFKNIYPHTSCASTCCPNMLFFINRQALDDYYRTHINLTLPIEAHAEYFALSLDEANQVAQDIFEIQSNN
ncbi:MULTISPECIES: alkylmercury lyase family protein [Staphylococcus]|uniref:alkylmercury lyase family protein n=1 Tax=Staphylococcus TaxID=1279 RepID=UPI0021D03FC6|nr:alkylmercury lyase family protein [Staphylococcus sp. IVB6181]UXV34899.1 alkylmercury lyase family protein [Staphylococcus sp. IVB6181]